MDPMLSRSACRATPLDSLGEGREEGIRHLFRHPVDEARAELGDLAPDIGLDVVSEFRAAALGVRQTHLGAALGKTGDAALPLTRDGVAVRRIDVGEGDL